MAEGALFHDRQPGISVVSSNHRKGLLLTTSGAVFASFEGLLVRLVSVDSWTVILWRGVLLGLVMLAVMLATRRKLQIRTLGLPALTVIISFTGTVLFFISALNATTVANTLVIGSAAPLFATLWGWLFLKEKPTRATSFAVKVVFAGLAIIFAGSLKTSFIVGDSFALGYALSLAIYFVALERCAEDQIFQVIALGGLLSGLLAWPFASGGIGWGNDLWILLGLGIVVVPVATGFLSWGPQYIPGSHVTLIMMVEIVLGPLWVWMMLREAPSVTTIFGGALVLAAIIGHSYVTATRPQKAVQK